MSRPSSLPRLLTAAALLVAATPRGAAAGPTVIRDDQLRDLAVTPVLGRGYSIATNTFQSICLSGMARTKPSYNFDYLFQEINEDGSTSSDTKTAVNASFAGGGWGIKVDASASAKATELQRTGFVSHHILVTIVIDVYYSSVDESASKLSDAALQLLKDRDLPGFFDACGMYYTRSINRKAKFDSLFSYKEASTQRNTSFEAELKAKIKGWGQSAGLDVQRSTAFEQKASSKQLTIKSAGFGLGKNEAASLIAYDLPTFQAAVKNAFTAMQADDVGMVTSIEVAPWVENSEFQRNLQLVPQEITVTNPDGTQTTKRLLPYAQKRILNQNSEFLAEVDRAARGKLNVFYKAKQCRATIDFDYRRRDDQGNYQFRELPAELQTTGPNPMLTWGDRMAVGHRVILEQAPREQKLSEISDAASLDNINLMFKEYDSFMYGGTDPAWGNRPIDQLTANVFPSDLFPGAATCVANLLDAGITTQSYRNLPACQRVEERFAVVAGRVADDFCLPTLR